MRDHGYLLNLYIIMITSSHTYVNSHYNAPFNKWHNQIQITKSMYSVHLNVDIKHELYLSRWRLSLSPPQATIHRPKYKLLFELQNGQLEKYKIFVFIKMY